MFNIATAAKQDAILRTLNTIALNQALIMADTTKLLAAVESLKATIPALGTELSALRQEHATTQPAVDAATAAVVDAAQALTDLTKNPVV